MLRWGLFLADCIQLYRKIKKRIPGWLTIYVFLWFGICSFIGGACSLVDGEKYISVLLFSFALIFFLMPVFFNIKKIRRPLLLFKIRYLKDKTSLPRYIYDEDKKVREAARYRLKNPREG